MKYLIDLTSLSEKNTGIEYVAENAAISMLTNFCNDSFVLVFNQYIPVVFRKYYELDNVQIIKLDTNN